MMSQPDTPTPWIGTEELPVHYANAYGVVPAVHAIFMIFGSAMPPTPGIGGTSQSYVAVRPIVRLAIAPSNLPPLIAALQEAYDDWNAAQNPRTIEGNP